jgi:4-hydroxybenzoate polyprenyltransferase
MKNQFAELTSLSFWKAYWITMRPYLLFVSAAAGMVGFAAGARRGMAVTLGAFVVFFLSYGFGQSLTDCFQIDTDSISSPYRPLVQGFISRRNVLLVSLLGLFGGCFFLFLLNPLTLLFTLLCVIGLATYTYFKRRWWGGPFYNAWIVAFLPFVGKLAADGTRGFFPFPFKEGVLLFIMLSVFFSYANFVLMGYFKDITADRVSGYNTFVVSFGWNKAAIASDIFAFFSLLFSGLGISIILSHDTFFSWRWMSIPLYLCGFATLILAQISVHRTKDEKEAYRPITHVVRAFVLLHLAETSSIRPDWIPFLVFFYICFELVLKKRPEKRQV